MKPVVFLPEAEQEMLEAAGYYESQRNCNRCCSTLTTKTRILERKDKEKIIF